MDDDQLATFGRFYHRLTIGLGVLALVAIGILLVVAAVRDPIASLLTVGISAAVISLAWLIGWLVERKAL